MTIALRCAALLCVLVTAGCLQSYNYDDPAGPRYVGSYAATLASVPSHLRIVTFNIQFSRAIDRAATLLEDHPHMRDADIILLQEMDAPGVETLAKDL